MYTLLQSINAARPYIQYSPLNAGTGFEPAVSIGSTVRNTILNPPFYWPWNRKENTTLTTVIGQQDYVVNITDFGYLEKVTLKATVVNASGIFRQFEIKNIYNTYILAPSDTDNGEPDSCCVKMVTYGTSVAIRFIAVPDQVYDVTITYQALPVPFQQFNLSASFGVSGGNTTYNGVFNIPSFVIGSLASVSGFTDAGNNGTFPIISVTGTNLVLANPNGASETPTGFAFVINSDWSPIPDSFIDIYNNLFLAEAFSASDDARVQEYRVRGMAALLAKAEGLNELQVNVFLSQWLATTDAQTMAKTLRTQTGSQARSI